MRNRAGIFAAAGIVLCLHLAAGVFAAEAGAESASEQRAEGEWHRSTEFPIWTGTSGTTWKDERTGAEVKYTYPDFSIGIGGMEALQNALDAYSEEQENEGRIFAQQKKADILRTFRERGNKEFGTSERNCESSIIRADEHIVSVLTRICESDWATPNETEVFRSLNMNPSTGEIAGIRDVIRTPDALPAILEQTFALQYDPETLYSSVSEVTQQLMDQDRFYFVVGMEGMSFFYPPRFLSPALSGYTILTLYYDEYPELFVEGIPFEGNYCTKVNPYLDFGYFENGTKGPFQLARMVKENDNGLYYRAPGDEKDCLAENFYRDIEDSVYFVRADGRHVFYIYAPETYPDMEPEASFKAFVCSADGVPQETESDRSVIPYLLDPIDQSSIELEAYVHPEHAVYDMYLDGDISVGYEKNDGTREYRYFDPETEERHAFIDLDGDGTDEMYIESADHSWPYSFYSVSWGWMDCIEPEEHEEAGADGDGGRVLVTDDGRVVATGDGTDGRESCRVYRYTSFRQFALETAYTRVRNDPNRPGDDICTRYTEGTEEEITVQEYQSAVEELLSQAIEMPFVESSGD